MKNETLVTIRKATASDVPAIAAILRELGYSAHINAESPTATEQRIGEHFALCAASNSHTIYVAQLSNGNIAGYAAVHWLPYLLLTGPEGYVSELFVRTTEQGRGIGTLLLDTLKEEGRRRGCSRLSLLNMRNRESYRRGYYKKVGWEERENAANFILPLK
jgi:N-acetylglutamate synthase-like GNAT family acetyltransferase